MQTLLNIFLALMVACSAAAFSLLPSAPDAASMIGCLGLSGAFAALALGAACLFTD